MYKSEQLWLRSDISRLLKIFDVATPTSVSLEKAQSEIKQLKYELTRQEKFNQNLNMELKMRYELLHQLKEKELQNGS